MKPFLRAVLAAFLLAGVLLPSPLRAARPPSFEVEWGSGGASAPYELFPFRHPSAGQALFAVGNTGGVSAVGRGAPLWRWAAGNTQIAGAASGDLDGDGTDDVAVGVYQTDSVVVLSGVDGDVLAERDFAATPEGIAVGDADGDGESDLYVVTQSDTGMPHTVNLFLGPHLELAWSVPLAVEQQIVMATEAGDLDGDGRDDVVFGTYNNVPKVYAFGSDGAKRWEVDLTGTVSNVVIADGGRTVLASRAGGLLASIDSRTGAVRWSLPSALGFSDLAAADLDADGTDDAVWTLYGPSGKSPTFHVLAVDGVTGRPMWAQTTLTPPKSVAIGDVTGDGQPDVAVSTQDAGSGTEVANFVWAYEGSTGRPLWSHAVAGEHTTFLSDVTFADVAGDTREEVVVAPYFDVLLGLDAADGAKRWSMPLGSGVSSAVAADLDGDGAPEVVDGGGDFRVTAREGETGAVRWSRDLGGQVYFVATIPSGGGRDVLALALSSIYRLRGSDGAVRWSWPLQGLGTEVVVVPQASGEPLLAVGARARRTELGPPSGSAGGQLSILGSADGRPRWQLQTVGTPWYLEAADVNADGAQDLAVGMTNNNAALAVYDGSRLGTLPVALWQGASDGPVSGLTLLGGRLVTARSTVNAIVAQDAATGTERWRRAMGSAVRLLGSGDVNADGMSDALVATDTFAEKIAAVSGTTGDVLFHVPTGVRFVKAAAWTDVSGDGAADLLFSSDGGTFGNGGIFAMDGTTLGSTEPRTFWSYPDVNASGLVRVPFEDADRWLGYGFSVRPHTLTLLLPIPEDLDAE